MEDDAAAGLLEHTVRAERVQVHEEPAAGFEPLHHDEHARMQAADRTKAVLLLASRAEPLHHAAGEAAADERECTCVVAQADGQ